MKRQVKLSVVIPTYNCRTNLRQSLLSLPKDSEVVVVDMGSIDGTLSEAKRHNAKIYLRQVSDGNFDANRKFGMQKASGDWLLKLDSDEALSLDLRNEISQFLRSENAKKFNGVYLLNETWMFGKRVKYGVVKRGANELRLVKRGKWSYDPFKFHQLISVYGPTTRSKYPYMHYNFRTVSEFLAKTNKYTELDYKYVYTQNLKLRLLLAPLTTFLRLYFFQLGFLDSRLGLEVCLLYSIYNLIEKTKKLESLV